MKYKKIVDIIPLEQRKEINKKILFIIDSEDKQGITKEDIFNSYTEKGGNHDLLFKDFDNYYEYSQKKKEIEEGQFFTPDEIIKEVFELLNPSKSDLISDLTSGVGSFINHAPNESNFYANEIDKYAVKVSKYLYPKSHISQGNIKYYTPNIKFNIILGNPPFNLKISDYVSQLYYFIKSNELLNHGGLLSVIVPISFLNDDFKDKSQISIINEHFNFIGQYQLDKNCFENANIKTKVMFFQKKSEFLDKTAFNNAYTTKEQLSSQILQVKEKSLKIHAKIHFENVKHSNNNYSISNPKNNTTTGYDFKLKKYLYEIKQHKIEKYQICLQHIEKLKNQIRPVNLTDKEWDKIKVTENKVLSYIKRYLKVKKIKQEKSIISDKKYNRKFDNKPFNEMQQDNKINKFLKRAIIGDKKLNDNQLEITNLFCQQRYSLVNVQQGGGKSLISLFTHIYRQKYNNISNTFIVAPSIAINGNWNEILNEYNLPYIMIKTLKDIDNIKKNDIVIITPHYLGKYKRQLMKFVKGKKIFTILDESHIICNVNSQIYKNMYSVFKHSTYKMLLTGTSTKNNLTELFPQLSFMYLSSVNFVDKNEYYYIEDIKTKKIISRINPNYNNSFKMYHKGLTEFSRGFNPSKSTVFGAGKQDQDVYNITNLKQILDYSVITKSLEDIMGYKIFKYHQETCKFSFEEIELYKKIINRFYELRYRYFSKIENSRKDSMFVILQQLNLLLKASDVPHTFREVSAKWSNKFLKVKTIIDKFPNDRIAIGVTKLQTVEEYRCFFSELNRPLFVITGDIQFKKRLSIIEQLKNTKNGILLCTQQALSCSINIDFVNKVIIPSLQWNMSSISQFIFRCIRYTSKEQKDVYFVTYENSIETNLLKLLTNKELLNEIAKNSEMSYDDIYSDMGINEDMFDNLMSKEKDEDGKTQINFWTEQKVS